MKVIWCSGCNQVMKIIHEEEGNGYERCNRCEATAWKPRDRRIEEIPVEPERRSSERRTTADRRVGDRRKVDLGRPEGDRRVGERRLFNRRQIF